MEERSILGTATLTPEMTALLAKAMAAGDMAEVIKIASSLKKEVSAADKAELEAKKGQIEDLGNKIRLAVQDNIVNRFATEIVQLVGEKKAIINVSWSYEDPITVVKIHKGSSGKGGKRISSGGTPQKFDMTTEKLLELYGSQVMDAETKQTYTEAWTVADKDKNKRFQVRKKLIKLHQAQD